MVIQQQNNFLYALAGAAIGLVVIGVLYVALARPGSNCGIPFYSQDCPSVPQDNYSLLPS